MNTYQERRARRARKPTAKQREEQRNWEAMLKKWNITPGRKAIAPEGVQSAPMGNRLALERIAANRSIPSVQGTSHDCSPAPTASYTGDQMLGVAVMHKSNAVPVFSSKEAEDITKMRRG